MNANTLSSVLIFLKKSCRVLWTAVLKYAHTDGEQRAASFAYYALFALFPLLVLCVTVSSQFIDKKEASDAILRLISKFIPMGAAGEDAVIKTVIGVVNTRKPVGIFAMLLLVWGSFGFFHALVRGVNRAWGTLEYPWYRLPFKNLVMVGILGSALFIGIVAPAIAQTVESYLWKQNPTVVTNMMFYTVRKAQQLLPWFVLFYAFSMFYKFAPRQHRQFGEVWFSALFVTVALQALRNLFVLFTQNFLNFNKLYGALGGVVGLLMWIYLSGSIIILGGCLNAAQVEIMGRKEDVGKEETPGV
jgi:YihY family inner membrane protein